ncbi:hypothetical protein FQR65_LT16153 [Abscondita terminalis]|nr:hypothetical protein FQR65_LT16153 [Abscondita terminalis]
MTTNDEWITERTGIKQRHYRKNINDAEETTAYLGLQASKKAIESAGLTAKDIDYIVFATLLGLLFSGMRRLLQEMLGCDTIEILLNGKKSKDKEISSKETGVNAQLVFNPSDAIEIKVALSTTSADKALEALNEIPNWNFDQVAANADKVWENEVSKIKIEAKSKSLKRIFYSALYHTALTPTLYSDKGWRIWQLQK